MKVFAGICLVMKVFAKATAGNGTSFLAALAFARKVFAKKGAQNDSQKRRTAPRLTLELLGD